MQYHTHYISCSCFRDLNNFNMVSSYMSYNANTNSFSAR
ncbi:unnamed protein product [Tenebrio molitor]|nr:unnamed protein product [Tenebrio molitor]